MQNEQVTRSADTHSGALAAAMAWLQSECRRHPDRNPRAVEVLRQLCWTAAAGSVAKAQTRADLMAELLVARDLAERVDRLFTDADVERSVAVHRKSRGELEQLWQRYRLARGSTSPSLDRLLLEAFLCSDMQEAAGNVRRLKGHAHGLPMYAGLRTLALALAAVGAVLFLAHAFIPFKGAFTVLAPSAYLVPMLMALCCALGVETKKGRQRRLVWRQTTESVRQVLRRGADLPALTSALRLALLRGLTWSPETIELLVRRRTSASNLRGGRQTV